MNFRRFRFMRRRMTIAAPKMSVRTHIPWYWRGLFWILVLSISTASAAWIYDAGRKFAGFDRNEVQQELSDLRAQTGKLSAENASLKADGNAAGSRLSIEQTAQRHLAEQVRALERENTRLKEDLALFEGMVAADRKEGSFAINNFKVEVDKGRLRYRMLLSRGARTGSILGGNQEPEFTGRVEFHLFENATAVAADGKGEAPASGMIRLPSTEEAGADNYRVKFRYFQRLDGELALPAGSHPKQVQVRLLEGDKVKATQTVNLAVPDSAGQAPESAGQAAQTAGKTVVPSRSTRSGR